MKNIKSVVNVLPGMVSKAKISQEKKDKLNNCINCLLAEIDKVEPVVVIPKPEEVKPNRPEIPDTSKKEPEKQPVKPFNPSLSHLKPPAHPIKNPEPIKSKHPAKKKL